MKAELHRKIAQWHLAQAELHDLSGTDNLPKCIADGECSVLYPGKAWIAEDGWVVSLISPADLAQLDKMEE